MSSNNCKKYLFCIVAINLLILLLLFYVFTAPGAQNQPCTNLVTGATDTAAAALEEWKVRAARAELRAQDMEQKIKDYVAASSGHSDAPQEAGDKSPPVLDAVNTAATAFEFPVYDSFDALVQMHAEWIDKLQIRKGIFWANDFHIATVSMLKEALQLVNPEIQVIDKSLSGHCHITKTCATDLRVFNRDNAFFMHGNMEHHRQLFWESYRGDAVMRTVDAFFCSLPCALCEAFMPFNKSLLVMFPTRYEAGRLSPPEWQKWNQNLLKIATSPKNILVANNLYDAEYVKYFTGLKDILVFESYSGYTNAEYKGTDNRILIGPGRLTVDPKTFFTELHSLAKQKELKYTFHPLREIYGSYGFQDLANHVAILNIPYQVSVMSFFEMYRMNIPLLFPTRKLLAEWVIKHKIMNERTWEGVFNRPKQSSLIPKHPSVNIPYDPNNEVDKEHIEYWLQFSDFYQWPHIILFDSWEDLVNKVQHTNFAEISQRMRVYNAKKKIHLIRKWKLALYRMFKDGTQNGPDVRDATQATNMLYK